MGNNIGKTIRGFALILLLLLWTSITIFTIIGIKFMCFVAAVYSILALIGSTFTYFLIDGFAELIERVISIEEKLNNLESEQNTEYNEIYE